MTTSEILRPSKHGDGQPRALILAPFAKRELQRLAGKLHIEYESWMDSRRLHDPDELAAKLDGLGASVLVIELDFVFPRGVRGGPKPQFRGDLQGSHESRRYRGCHGERGRSWSTRREGTRRPWRNTPSG